MAADAKSVRRSIVDFIMILLTVVGMNRNYEEGTGSFREEQGDVSSSRGKFGYPSHLTPRSLVHPGEYLDSDLRGEEFIIIQY
jgi:hypothetical protein